METASQGMNKGTYPSYLSIRSSLLYFLVPTFGSPSASPSFVTYLAAAVGLG